MRAARVFSVLLTAAVLMAGCTATHQERAAQPTSHRTAPPDPDFTPVIERFYQQLQGAHWVPAYGMLSPRYRETFSRGDLESRYRDFSDASIDARQTGPRTVEVKLRTPGGGAHPPRLVRETVTFLWNGEEWTIDRIDRREIAQ